MDKALRLAAQELITTAALPPVTAKDLLSREFWQRLNPDLALCGGDALAFESETLKPDEVEAVADSLRRKGLLPNADDGRCDRPPRCWH